MKHDIICPLCGKKLTIDSVYIKGNWYHTDCIETIINLNQIKNGQHMQDMLYVIKAIMLTLDLKTLKVPKRFLWKPDIDIFIAENPLTNEYVIELENRRLDYEDNDNKRY